MKKKGIIIGVIIFVAVLVVVLILLLGGGKKEEDNNNNNEDNNDIEEVTKLSSNEVSEFDLEFGKLQILIESDTIRYKFVPSKEFESMLINTINSKESPLIKALEDTMTEKIISTYKELL